MAGRHYNQFRFGLEKMPVDIRATFYGAGNGANIVFKSFNPAGTIGAIATGGFRGIKSVARTGDGDYTITFQDNYQRFLGMTACVTSLDNSTAPVANAFYIVTVDPAAAGGATIKFRTYLGTIGSLVAPAANDRWDINVVWSNSGAM